MIQIFIVFSILISVPIIIAGIGALVLWRTPIGWALFSIGVLMLLITLLVKKKYKVKLPEPPPFLPPI